MRRFLAATAVIGASLISAAPDALAQCRNGWCTGGCSDQSGCEWIKLKNRGYPVRRVINRDKDSEFVMDYDCQRHTYRFVNDDGTVDPWGELMPGTKGERSLEVACNM